jgi:uncharacterized membrane protein YeaQ/YmgE (transglycosylase-associated protein family)
MGIISWLILGLIAGFIGSKIVNKSGQGFWLDIALGIVGAQDAKVIDGEAEEVSALPAPATPATAS